MRVSRILGNENVNWKVEIGTMFNFEMLLMQLESFALKLLSYRCVWVFKRKYIARTTILMQVTSVMLSDRKILLTQPQALITLPAAQSISFIHLFLI